MKNIFTDFKKTRIARQCVCCGSSDLKRSPAVLMPFVAHRVFDWQAVDIDDSWGLSTIKSGRAYSICNSLFCESCDFLFLDIRFDDDEMARLYNGYRGLEYTELREIYEPGYKARNDHLNDGIGYGRAIESFLAPHLPAVPSVLDFGGDTGKNTPFKDISKVIHIYDISDKPVLNGVQKVTLEELSKQKYDLIVCSNVLEHTPYPHEILGDILMQLSRDSVLYIEVPFEKNMVGDSVNRQLFKRHWHEHINFYSESSIAAMLDGLGLKILAKQILNSQIGNDSITVLQFACKLKS